jgi:hypothetical protein
MPFRRIYWITEHVRADGSTQASGIYTSVYDLVERGLPRHTGGLRLTLVKVDSDRDPLGSYSSPAFEGLAEDLLGYAATDEITEEQRNGLLSALRSRFEQAV